MEYAIQEMPMICGRAEPEQRRFRKYDCAAGVYLVAIQDACADHVYYHNPKDKNSDGFGGATLRFPLEDGTVYEAKGPWKCAASYLLTECGVDIEDKYSTFLVVGKGRRLDKNSRSVWGGTRVITDLIHKDEAWQISRFDRECDFISTLPSGEYHYYIETAGGSSSGVMTPEEATRRVAARRQRKSDSHFVVSAEQSR
jgi:hypothetical protein